jgi:hypothetical protein
MLLNYFRRHGYLLVGKHLSRDRVNLSFSPAERIGAK